MLILKNTKNFYKSFILKFSFLTIFLTILVFIISLIFLSKSYYNAIGDGNNGSYDFIQWYDMSKLFWDRIDLFQLYFSGKIKWQPIWNHALYIIFFPYILFPLKIAKILWFFSNLIFTYLIIKVVKKNYNLSINKTLLLSILIISSTPFTNTLGNGQLSLFLLFSIITYWFSNNKFKSCFLSIAFIKLSIGLFFIINSLLKKEIDIIYAILIFITAVLFYCFWVNNFDLNQFINPLIIAQIHNIKVNDFHGIGNLKFLFTAFKIDKYYFIALIIFVIINTINIFLTKKSDKLFLIILISTLFFTYHRIYDFVFLIPLAGYLLKTDTQKVDILINAPTILFYFYFVRFNQLILNNFFDENTIGLIGTFLIIISLFFFYLKKIKIRK